MNQATRTNKPKQACGTPDCDRPATRVIVDEGGCYPICDECQHDATGLTVDAVSVPRPACGHKTCVANWLGGESGCTLFDASGTARVRCATCRDRVEVQEGEADERVDSGSVFCSPECAYEASL